jgi:hypothetical protein
MDRKTHLILLSARSMYQFCCLYSLIRTTLRIMQLIGKEELTNEFALVYKVMSFTHVSVPER